MRLETIKASNWKVKGNLREVHKVIQWKDDCIYRTKSLGLIVCARDYNLLGNAKDIQIGSCSTKITMELLKQVRY